MATLHVTIKRPFPLPPSIPPSLPHLEVRAGWIRAAFYYLTPNLLLVGISQAVLGLHGLDVHVLWPDLGREGRRDGGTEGRREGRGWNA